MPTPTDRRRKAAAATVVSAVAVTALVGGTLASFTDSDSTTPQVLRAGTVQIDLVEGATWNTNLTNLAVGDTADRSVLVDNASTLDIGKMRLTAALTDTVGEFGGKLSEAVTVDITQDGGVALAEDVRLADLADGYDLVFAGADLPAGTDSTLGFHYEVVGAPTDQTGDRTRGQRDLSENPDNKYQGSALSVTYTLDAIQRAGSGAAADDGEDPVVSGTVIAWGRNTYGQTNVPTDLGEVTQVAAGINHSVALRDDGTVRAWGLDTLTNVPVGLSGVTQIAASAGQHTLALKQDGSVVAWGYNASGQTNVPADLHGVVQVATGGGHSVALRSDGKVVAWGQNTYGQTNVPAGLADVVQVAAGGAHTVAVKSDGTVVAWGWSTRGQTTPPAGLTGVVQVSAGSYHSVALKSDGTVVAWGSNDYGQSSVPAGLTDVAQIAAGGDSTVALRNDGTVIAWGRNQNGQTTVPDGLSGVLHVAAGREHTLAITTTP